MWVMTEDEGDWDFFVLAGKSYHEFHLLSRKSSHECLTESKHVVSLQGFFGIATQPL